jgi:hypothetical protein
MELLFESEEGLSVYILPLIQLPPDEQKLKDSKLCTTKRALTLTMTRSGTRYVSVTSASTMMHARTSSSGVTAS